MLLHKNHSFSVGKGSKHINVRYFFVVDKVEKKKVKIMCCLMEKTVAYYRSKPIQGRIFVVHRNTMLGVSADDHRLRKRWHKESLERRQLWDDMEKDLDDLQDGLI